MGDRAKSNRLRTRGGARYDHLLPVYTGAELRAERWKVARVDGKVFDKYAISSLGRVRNLHTGRLIKLLWCVAAGYEEYAGKDCGVYWRVNLYDYRGGKRCVFVHRLVAELFVGGRTEDRKYVHHKNNVSHDPRATNLEWVTQSKNMLEYVLWRKGLISLPFAGEHEAYPEPCPSEDYGYIQPEPAYHTNGHASDDDLPF